MKFIRVASTLLVFCCSSPALPEAPQSGFCAQLREVYDTRTRGFRPLRGPFDEDIEAFHATVALPGAERCRIEEDDYSFEYRCSWAYAASDAIAAINAAKTLYQASSQCLHPGFNPVLSDQPPSALDARTTVLWQYPLPDKDRRSKIEIRVTQRAATRLLPERVTLFFEMKYALR
jgi:hypothetical protein